MERSKLKEEDLAAWSALALLEADGARRGFIRPLVLDAVLGWERGKIRSVLGRLAKMGFIMNEVQGQHHRCQIISDGEATTSDKLQAAQARADRRFPVRIADDKDGVKLILSDDTFAFLPEEMCNPEMFDMWMKFALTMDQRLKRDGKNFSPEMYIGEMMKIVNAGKKTNSYNICYVHNAYTEYIKTSKYNVEIANKQADKSECTAPKKAEPAPKKVAEVDRKAREKHVGGIIQGAYIEAGFSIDVARDLVRGIYDKYEQRLARIPGEFPSDAEIEAAALACAEKKDKNECTPPKLANRVGNARNPNAFKKTAAAPAPDKANQSMRTKFAVATEENPHLRAELADLCRQTNSNFNDLNPLEQGDAIFQLFKAVQLAGGAAQ